MFIHGIDMDREFDLILQRSIPYIIFPPRDMYGEFIDKLIGDLATLCQYKNGNDDVLFINHCKNVSILLDNAWFHTELMEKIRAYNYNQVSITNAFKEIAKKQGEIEDRLKKLESFKSNKKDNKQNDHLIPQTNAHDLVEKMHLATYSQKTVIEQVYAYLKEHPGTHTETNIADGLKLTKNQIKGAFSRIYLHPEFHAEKISHIKRDSIKYKPNPTLREYPQITYQWVESLAKNETQQ